ncbi:MAG: CapA family protein, partial [Jatrophihabitantaceae bacterium]
MTFRRPTAILGASLLLLAGCTHVPAHPIGPGRSSQQQLIAGSTPSSAGSTGPTPSSASRQPRTVTVLGSGDVLIHPPLWQQAAADARADGHAGYDFSSIYRSIAPDVHAADLATCELETPLAPAGGPFSGWPDFSAPPQVLTALKADGYTSCTTASNHTLDQGYAGVARTLAELDAAGLRHTGSARSAAEAARPLIETTQSGVKVAQLAYAFGFNGIVLPAGQPWLANLTAVPAILAAAHRARLAGADIVVLSMHWGTEYQHQPTEEQRSQARALLASPDIDVILGDHVHVVQPFEQIGGKWVAYGMGNQISRHADPIDDSREGVMPRFTFAETSPHHWRVVRAEAIATWMQLSPRLRLIDVPRALADPATTPSERATYLAARSHI